MTKNKKQNKNLIFLKSTVIAGGIVFLVLLVLLIILKINNNNKTPKLVANCNPNQKIIINNAIDEVFFDKKDIVLLTKAIGGKQELLTLDKKCGLIKSKIELIIK